MSSMFIVELFRVYLNSYWSVCMNFPKIHKITINNFSLYKQKDEIELDLKDGVFCLAGANGLGKSTFLSILNYALTGIVPDPQSRFASINHISQYYDDNMKFALSYFKGRISESNRDNASVEIEFEVNNYLYKLKRNFFKPNQIEEFSRKNILTEENSVDTNHSKEELLKLYKQYIEEDVGVALFEQYAFIQIFILTFDEHKKMLFWDSSIMNRTLELFFGINPEQANLADELRKNISSQESYMRNSQWSIKKFQDDLKILEQGKPEQELIDKGQQLCEELENIKNLISECSNEVDAKNEELNNCNLNISDISIRLNNLDSKYEEVFNQMQNGNIPIEKNEEVIKILRDIAYKILNDEAPDEDFHNLQACITSVAKTLKQNVEENCMNELKQIDNKINDLKKDLQEYGMGKKRIENELNDAIKHKTDLHNKYSTLKEKNNDILNQYFLYKNQYSGSNIESLKISIEREMKKKENYTKQRDELKAQLLQIEKEIQKNYQKTEKTFLPIFKKYANSFIGLDIDVYIKPKGSDINLVLKINNTERVNQFQLSESQQYFIDIALRFALIELSNTKNAAILIDTPEGALDIAYESRAGKMFGNFINNGYDIVMTANINSSQLLIQLAKICKSRRMLLEKMTNWTELSEVQKEEQKHIEKAFSNIMEELNAN